MLGNSVFFKGIEGLFDQFVSVLEVTGLNVRGHALHQLGLKNFNVHCYAVLSSGGSCFQGNARSIAPNTSGVDTVDSVAAEIAMIVVSDKVQTSNPPHVIGRPRDARTSDIKNKVVGLGVMKRVVLYLVSIMILSPAFSQRRSDDSKAPPFLVAGHLEILDRNNSVIAKISEEMDPAAVMAAARAVNPKVKVVTIDKVTRSSAGELAYNIGLVEESVAKNEVVKTPPLFPLPVSDRMKGINQICPAQCWFESLRFNLSKSGQFQVMFVGPDQGSLHVSLIMVALTGAASTPSPRSGDTITRRYYLTQDDAFIVYRVDNTDTVQMKQSK